MSEHKNDPTEPNPGPQGVQGVQGVTGKQGLRGRVGQRGASAEPDDAPRWMTATLRALIPAYLILGLAIGAAFYVGYQYAEGENERICEVVVATTRGTTEALIAASSQPRPPGEERTPEEQARFDAAVAHYRASIEKALAPCHPDVPPPPSSD